MRHSFNDNPIDFKLPDPIQIQRNSYNDFLENGISETLKEVGVIQDNTGRNWELSFSNPRIEKPNRTVENAIKMGLTYDAPWYVTASVSKTGSSNSKKKEIYMGDLPLMTNDGTFVINGVTKVVISQLARAQGICFTREEDKTTKLIYPTAKVLPKIGVWLDLEVNKYGVMSVRIDRKRKIPITVLLRIFGLETDESILEAFKGVFEDETDNLLVKTLQKDTTSNYLEAAVEIYMRLRPGDPVTHESATSLVEDIFFNSKRYSLGDVGRFKLNMKLGLDTPIKNGYFTLQQTDVVEIVKYLIGLHLRNEGYEYDDMDSLSNRRIRSVGELIQFEMKYGFYQLERLVKERMALQPRNVLPDPQLLISPRPISARIISYLASGQLSQLLGEFNPLESLDHKRKISVLGKGGLSKERASYAVRDSHPTHYGRIGAVRSPEGQHIGLLTYLALYAKPNKYGFLETPYVKLEKQGKKIKVTDEIEYLASYDEHDVNIAGGDIEIDSKGYIVPEKIGMRRRGHFFMGARTDADYIEIAPQQILGISAALIPFIANDDVARALIAAQQSSQAVPLVRPQAPLVGTGLEEYVAKYTGLTVNAGMSGVIEYIDASRVVIKGDKGKEEHKISNFEQSNKDSCFTQLVKVKRGQKVKRGDVIAEGPSCEDGELALGVNLRAAFMVYEGFNYEDAFIISSRVVEEDLLSSITISDYTLPVLDTKLGPEEVTADIPNVSEDSLRNLDSEGIAMVGAKVKAGDILVGKITPKGHSELSAEERLLRAVFGEGVREVQDNSLKLPNGREGVVIDINVITSKDKDKMAKGVLKEISVKVAEYRKITVGDKLSGRHGQKGVIAKIVPKEDMPHLEDGTIVDVIISPSSILGRMNIGNILETHLGWAAEKSGKKYAIPPFIPVSQDKISSEFINADLPEDGKTKLIDGKTGEYYDQEVTVGMAYIFKLHHMAEDKMHARSTGPYSLITQQPLGGKAQLGGQKFGEMEVWALEAYGAASNLHEMLTIKSDDIQGRFKAFQAITKGLEIPPSHIPESFKLLVRQLNGLCLNLNPIRREKEGYEDDGLSKIAKEMMNVAEEKDSKIETSKEDNE